MRTNDLRIEFNNRIRNKYLKDNHICECEKCKQSKKIVKLHVHHKIPLADGGSNNYENLIALCNRCHNEWHSLECVKITFDEWMQLPPYSTMIKALQYIFKGEHDNIKINDLKRAFKDEFYRYIIFGNSFDKQFVQTPQKKGIERAKQEGKYKGRKPIEYPKQWDKYYTMMKDKHIKAIDVMKILDLKKTTFYKLLKQYEDENA